MVRATPENSGRNADRLSGERALPANDRQAQQKAVETDERVNEEARRQLISEEAYYTAERRGFAPGGELEDWLTAEAKVDLSLSETRLQSRSVGSVRQQR